MAMPYILIRSTTGGNVTPSVSSNKKAIPRWGTAFPYSFIQLIFPLPGVPSLQNQLLPLQLTSKTAFR